MTYRFISIFTWLPYIAHVLFQLPNAILPASVPMWFGLQNLIDSIFCYYHWDRVLSSFFHFCSGISNGKTLTVLMTQCSLQLFCDCFTTKYGVLFIDVARLYTGSAHI